MAVKNLVSLAWLKYHGVVDTSLPFRERTYPIIFIWYSDIPIEKDPKIFPLKIRGSVSRIYFFLLQFGLISGRCGRFNRRKTMRIWWNMPQFWDSQAVWLKRHIPVKKWHFQNGALFCCFFGICFWWPFGWVGCSSPLPSLRQFGQVLLHIPLASPSFWSPESSRETICSWKVYFYTQLIPLYLWRDVRNHPKLVFHSILSHLVNLVKVSDSGRIHSSPQKPSTRLERVYFPRTGMHRFVEKKRHSLVLAARNSSTEFVL